MNSKQIVDNVKYLYDTYGDKIKSDKHLILLYWQVIDKIKMDKENISTVDYLKKSTCPIVIVNGKAMLDAYNMSE